MSDPKILRDREKALEEQFFAKHNEELKRKLREHREKAERREQLQAVAGVSDEATLDRLVESGITAETWAAVALVPLVVAAIPFMGRVVEQSLREVDPGLLEAAVAMGSTHRQVILRVLLPEALPSLVRGTALMVISVLGYSTMAGAVGGGGLGDLAVKYGYMRFRTDVMLGCLVVLLVLVQGVQLLGDRLASRLDL